MKGLTGAATIGAVILVSVVFVFAMVAYVVPALATQESDVHITPNITAGGQDDQPFEATVIAGEGHTIHEFRVYESGDFTDLTCNAKANWFGPYYGTNEFGNYCQWNAEDGYQIQPGDSDNFYFTMDSPDSECCRVMRTEPRDLEHNWQPKEIDICVDKTPPETEKWFEGPNKTAEIKGNIVEWIDGVTEVVLEARDDVGPHDAGIDKILYLNILAEDYELGEDPCWNPEACQPMFLSPPTECVLEVEDCCDENWEKDYDSWKECVEDKIYDECFGGEAPFRWQVYTGPFNKTEESCHILQYYSIDGVGNAEDVNVNCFFVDKTPPEIEKIVGEPKVEELDLEMLNNGKASWVTSQSYTGTSSAKLYVLDGANDWAGVDVKVDIPLKDITELSFWEYIASYIPKGWDVNVILGIDADNDGDFEADLAGWHIGPDAWTLKALNGDTFVQMDGALGPNPTTGVWTQINALSVSQWWTPDKSGAGFAKSDTYPWTFYDTFDNLINVFIPDYTQTSLIPDVNARVKLIKLLIGGSGSWKDEIAYVDNAKLNGDMIIDEPTGFTWVIPGTDITFTCTDQEPHPSGDEELCFVVSYDQEPDGYLTDEYCDKYAGEGAYMEGEWCCVDASPEPDSPFIFNFNEDEDSLHDLEYYCRDAVNKTSEKEIQWYKVDSIPPEIIKTMIGDDHLGQCPPVDQDCYVRDDGQNGIKIEVTDGGEICAVGVDYCNYALWWYTTEQECENKYPGHQYDSGRCVVESGKFSDYIDSDYIDIYFREDSTHELYVDCWDRLSNKMPQDFETFLVDSTPPETNKTLQPEGTFYIDQETGMEWIDTATEINLTAEDEKVGVDEIQYRVSGALADNFCENCENWMQMLRPDMGPWQTYISPFGIADESCHVVEYRSVDLLGNEEDIKWQCMFVDKTNPVAYLKNVGDPSFRCEAMNDSTCDYWVRDHVTEIKLGCRFGPKEPHPAPLDKLYWRIKVDDEPWGKWQETDAEEGATFVFTEDSYHTIEYYCTDKVGKVSNNQSKIFRVDSTPPVTTKTYIPDAYVDPKTGLEYIDTAHEIKLEAEDGGEICPIGVDKIEYRVSGAIADNFCENWMQMLRPDMGPWNTYTTPFGIADESCHVIEYRSVDLLGNEEEINWQCVFVDKTPPEINKTYGKPYFTNGSAEWISIETPIYVTVTDPQPHPSGVKKVEYRITRLDGTDACWDTVICQEASGEGDWTTWNDEILGIEDESCHLIEIRAVDNVDKPSEHKQCVFVDNTPPNPLKEVGEPKEPWDGLDARFYDLEEFCLTPGNCWKITKLTPVWLECNDPDPHPVNHNGVCFKVEWDGDDVTTDYCEGGEYNETSGFCCVDHEMEFYFNKISEHNLQYYCVDALGNAGEIDDEKFKVEDTAFEIQINKKWNLISTPVRLLDDSMGAIFDELNQSVQSVWTYDPEKTICGYEWCVYTPGVGGNIDKMLPGWGYWVLADQDCMMLIGGSLMSPGYTTPPSKNIVTGWNLIGYYGAEGMEGYYGPAGNGGEAYSELCSIGESWWDKGFTSLMTYWEPYNPDMWVEVGRWDNMDPGAGYWMFAPGDGIYTFSNACDD